MNTTIFDIETLQNRLEYKNPEKSVTYTYLYRGELFKVVIFDDEYFNIIMYRDGQKVYYNEVSSLNEMIIIFDVYMTEFFDLDFTLSDFSLEE